jgi:hypothetical protein
MKPPEIKEILDSFVPFDLDEMGNARLMDRIDTKYVLSVRRIPDLLTLMDGQYRILEINSMRIFPYLTTYLDSDDYIFFNQHVTGKLERNKVRYRKYETTGKTFLEIKKRTNKYRTIKWRIRDNLPENGLNDRAIEFIQEHLPYDPLVLGQVLKNSFNRITFAGLDFTERITIDLNLSYSEPYGTVAGIPFLAVVEQKKKGMSLGTPFNTLIKKLSVHPTGFSKYCMGTALLYDLPRKNILKSKMLLINKIENEYNRSVSD